MSLLIDVYCRDTKCDEAFTVVETIIDEIVQDALHDERAYE
jgi:hypothetical protein